QVADGVDYTIEVRLAAPLDFFRRQFVNRVERRDIQAETGGFRAKRADPGRDIQDGFAAKTLQIQREVAPIFVERAPEQDDFVEHQPLFGGDQRGVHLPNA